MSFIFSLVLVTILCADATLTSYNIKNFAGLNNTVGFNGNGIPATSAILSYPSGVWTQDNFGSVIFSDGLNCRTRRIDSQGIILSFAGSGAYNSLGDNGPASSAGVFFPAGVWGDSTYSVFILEQGANKIRKVTAGTSNIISVYAGRGSSGFSGDNGLASSAQIGGPFFAAGDTAGNLFIGDTGNNRVRKVSASMTISTVAGRGSGATAGDGGPLTAATVPTPNGVWVDSSGSVIYVVEAAKVRKIDLGMHSIDTVAGTGSSGYSGDGVATSKALSAPLGGRLSRHPVRSRQRQLRRAGHRDRRVAAAHSGHCDARRVPGQRRPGARSDGTV